MPAHVEMCRILLSLKQQHSQPSSREMLVLTCLRFLRAHMEGCPHLICPAGPSHLKSVLSANLSFRPSATRRWSPQPTRPSKEGGDSVSGEKLKMLPLTKSPSPTDITVRFSSFFYFYHFIFNPLKLFNIKNNCASRSFLSIFPCKSCREKNKFPFGSSCHWALSLLPAPAAPLMDTVLAHPPLMGQGGLLLKVLFRPSFLPDWMEKSQWAWRHSWVLEATLGVCTWAGERETYFIFVNVLLPAVLAPMLGPSVSGSASVSPRPEHWDSHYTVTVGLRVREPATDGPNRNQGSLHLLMSSWRTDLTYASVYSSVTWEKWHYFLQRSCEAERRKTQGVPRAVLDTVHSQCPELCS